MRFRTKVGAVFAATALAALGFTTQANAWAFSMNDQSTNIADISICAATTSTPGSILFRGTSEFRKGSGQAIANSVGLGYSNNVLVPIFSDSALTNKILDVTVPQTVTSENLTFWLMTGDGTAVLPSSIAAGATIFGRDFIGGSVPLTVSNPSYGCGGGGSSIDVPVPTQSVANKLTTVSHPASAPVPVSIPAGSYDVVQGSLDDAHPTQGEQFNERWYAVFYGSGGAVVGTTATTPDLALADITNQWPAGVVVLTANATSVVYFHAPGGEGPDSIYPNLLRLTPSGTYPPAPKPNPDTPKPKAPKPETPKSEEPIVDKPKAETKPEAPKRVTELDVVSPQVIPVTPSSAEDRPSPSPKGSVASTENASSTFKTTPQVEVKGIQVENAAPAAAAVVDQVAFTGSESRTMISGSVLLIALGALALIAGRRRAPR
jgi:hypothetical protein